jgi:hypothetical protein
MTYNKVFKTVVEDLLFAGITRTTPFRSHKLKILIAHKIPITNIIPIGGIYGYMV